MSGGAGGDIQISGGAGVTGVVKTQATTLDLNDPFDAALWEMSQLHRKKRADYAADANRWSNFETTASLLGLQSFGTREAIEVNIAQKVARLQSLRLNGRMDDPQNESVIDTRRDLAVYSVLSLVYSMQQAEDARPQSS